MPVRTPLRTSLKRRPASGWHPCLLVNGSLACSTTRRPLWKTGSSMHSASPAFEWRGARPKAKGAADASAPHACERQGCAREGEGRRFVVDVALRVVSLPIIADRAAGWRGCLPALVCVRLGLLVCLGLRSSGLWAAVCAAGGLTMMEPDLL